MRADFWKHCISTLHIQEACHLRTTISGLLLACHLEQLCQAVLQGGTHAKDSQSY